MSNRLASESSPYLLQHRDNPVDWYPWGSEALERAQSEQKPIFLSIGYSACHWCHVMEHESFENESLAAQLNEHFINIKVDREERPDLDQIYMNAVQMLTGRGGWPMSVFLTPSLKPFYGGTYWPPEQRHGMPGFDQVIAAVAKAWNENREGVLETSERLTEELEQAASRDNAAGELSESLISGAVSHFRQTFDRTYGGFGGAPKFPAPMSLRLLLRYWHRHRDQFALDMVASTLDRMAAGGIYDHMGGGFARYSVDARWLVPHFEKMLYDNAQLAATYVEMFQITGNDDYARVARETIDYVLRDMTDPAGGFYSTEDADSEGEEGKFYTWNPEQLAEVLGDAAETFAKVYDVTSIGNFEATNILNLPKTIDQQAKLLGREPSELREELARSRGKLFLAREKRIHPHKDDKIIVAWNGLMISACALAGAVLEEPKYLDAARNAADFINTKLRRADGRLLHTYRHGEAKVDAFLDDYSYLACGLIDLYEATSDVQYLEQAIDDVDAMMKWFRDGAGGGFFYTAEDQEQLLVRNKEFADNAVPSGNAMAALALAKLAKLTGDDKYVTVAESTMQASVELMKRYPSATAQMLTAVDFLLGSTYELVLAGDAIETRSELLRRFLPNKVLAYAGGSSLALAALLKGKNSEGGPTLFVCEGFACQAPAHGEEDIRRALDKLTSEA